MAMASSPSGFAEWEAFQRFRASRGQTEGRPWVAVAGSEVLGCFATKDEAVDRLLAYRPNLADCSVFHWDEQPAELSLCVVFGVPGER